MTDRTPSSSGDSTSGRPDDPSTDADNLSRHNENLHNADLSAEQLDEIVSAYVDGEATDDEVALVDATPLLRERADAFRSLAAPIAAVEPIADDVRNAQIAAALLAVRPPDISIVPDPWPKAIIESTPSQAAPPPSRSTVIDLASRRRVPPRWLAIAACLLALAIIVPVALNASGTDSQDTATSGDVAQETELAAADKVPSATEAMDDADEGGAAAEADTALNAMPAESTDTPQSDGTDDAATATAGDAPASTTAVAARRANFFDVTDFDTGFGSFEAFAQDIESRRFPTVDAELRFDEQAVIDRDALVAFCPDLEIDSDADVIESVVLFVDQRVFGVVDNSSTTVYLDDCTVVAELP